MDKKIVTDCDGVLLDRSHVEIEPLKDLFHPTYPDVPAGIQGD